MRDIKFRGKMSTGFVFGDLVQDELDEGLLRIIDNAGLQYYVKKETVGQFTGLRDKSGIEIYEGDIIREGEKKNSYSESWSRIYEIRYAKYTVGANSYVGWCKFRKNKRLGSLYRHSTYFMEIIGNIHDNPELLTNK